MPLAAKALDTIVNDLIAARREGRRIPAPDLPPPSDADIYAIQDRVCAAIGPIGGWKTGPAKPGEIPGCAPIFAASIRDAGADPVVRLGKPVGIELEIAFVFRAGFSAGATPTDAEILAAVGSAHVAFELCDSRFENREAVPVEWRKADNTVNEGLALGPAIADPFALDLPRLNARLVVDGRTTVETTGGLPMTDVRPVLLWLVRHCIERRGGFPAGTVVTTGSWTGMQFHPPGSRITGAFDGVGEITIELA